MRLLYKCENRVFDFNKEKSMVYTNSSNIMNYQFCPIINIMLTKS